MDYLHLKGNLPKVTQLRRAGDEFRNYQVPLVCTVFHEVSKEPGTERKFEKFKHRSEN